MISMLETIAQQSTDRDVWFMHATRNGKAHAMKQWLNDIAQLNDNVNKLVWYEEVDPTSDKQGIDYDYEGRIDLSKPEIKDHVIKANPNTDYYLCGPLPFMQAMQQHLESLGVSGDRIHSETFGSDIRLA